LVLFYLSRLGLRSFFIAVLRLFTFSELVLAFLRWHCLQTIGLTMGSVTWNRFPIKNLWLIPCFFHLWSEVTWIQTCASLNHRKKMKAEHSWLIPLKPIKNVDLFIGYRVIRYENIFQTYAFISYVWPEVYLWCCNQRNALCINLISVWKDDFWY